MADFAKIIDFANEAAWQAHLNCLIPVVGKGDTAAGRTYGCPASPYSPKAYAGIELTHWPP